MNSCPYNRSTGLCGRRVTALLWIAAALIAGCGGSGRQPATPVTQVPPQQGPANPELPPAAALNCDAIAADPGSGNSALDALPGGIWTGTLTNVTSGKNSHIEGLVAEDGQVQIVSYSAGPILSAVLTTHGDLFTGTGLAYAGPNDQWSDGSRVTAIDTSGVVAERASIRGTWNSVSGDSGCFELGHYGGWLYEDESSLEPLAQVWHGDPTLTVDQDGRFFGQGTCTWSGEFALIDTRYNMYELNADLSDCGNAGSYHGLAYRGYVFVPERILVLAINSEQRAMRIVLDD